MNCILPGFVRTDRQLGKWLTPEFEETVLKNQRLAHLIEPEDVSALVVMIASNTAQAVTNQTLVVDAGWP